MSLAASRCQSTLPLVLVRFRLFRMASQPSALPSFYLTICLSEVVRMSLLGHVAFISSLHGGWLLLFVAEPPSRLLTFEEIEYQH